MVKQWYYQNVQYVVIKKTTLIKNQQAKGLVSNLGVRIMLIKVPILSDTLLWSTNPLSETLLSKTLLSEILLRI